MRDFYITLLSNSSRDIFADNTISQFRTKLPREIQLIGDWEVGLCDISFPKTFATPPLRIVITGPDGDKMTYKTKHRHFKTSEEFAKHLNNMLKAPPIFTSTSRKNMYKRLNRFRIEVDEFGYIKVTVPPKYSIRITKRLMNILGLKESQVEQMKNKSVLGGTRQFNAYKKCILHDIHSLFVYTDIIEPGIVGDSIVRLLDIIPVANDNQVLPSYRIDRPRYLPVQMGVITTPKIEIMTDSEEPPPFMTGVGRVIVKLHFKRVR